MHCGQRRIRGSLGTNNQATARRRVVLLDQAASEGQHSPLWFSLRLMLPVKTVNVLNRALLGPPPSFTLQQIESAFSNKLDRLLKFGRLASGTVNAYEYCVGLFVEWLGTRVQLMDELTTDLLERYFLERAQQIKNSPGATNGHGVLTDATAIRKFVQFCVEEKFRPPLNFPDMPKVTGETNGAEPFESDELERMEENADGVVRLAYLLLRWTGMRGQDVVALTWKEVDLQKQRITRVTQKCKKLVVVPMSTPLIQELEYWHSLLQPEEKDKVLPNFKRAKLAYVMQKLAEKSGVKDCHIHRFRSHFVVDCLERGVSIYDVSKIIGDQVATLDKHYARFTDKMQDRVRKVFEEVSS